MAAGDSHDKGFAFTQESGEILALSSQNAPILWGESFYRSITFTLANIFACSSPKFSLYRPFSFELCLFFVYTPRPYEELYSDKKASQVITLILKCQYTYLIQSFLNDIKDCILDLALNYQRV